MAESHPDAPQSVAPKKMKKKTLRYTPDDIAWDCAIPDFTLRESRLPRMLESGEVLPALRSLRSPGDSNFYYCNHVRARQNTDTTACIEPIYLDGGPRRTPRTPKGCPWIYNVIYLAVRPKT